MEQEPKVRLLWTCRAHGKNGAAAEEVPPMIASLEGSVSLAQSYFSCRWVFFLSVLVKK